MNTSALMQHPRFVAGGIRLDRLPAWGWLALQCAALSPTGVWMARRLGDGSDDPFGLLALATLGGLVWQARRRLCAAPRLGWLLLALLGTAAATLARGVPGVAALPPLLAGLLSVLALAAGLLAFLPRHQKTPRRTAARAAGVTATPVLGLAVLALPLLSSLQFYAGYPLRVITAEASRWLLAPAFTVLREGSTLLVDGRLVIVDAPCSGVQMAWLGYFTACAVALWAGRSDREFLTRLPLVGVLVLAGNIVRNSILVASEGAGRVPAQWQHDGLGLVLLALVSGSIAWHMGRAGRKAAPHTERRRRSTHGDSGLITQAGGRRVELA
ncbi:MAG: exosortase Q [Pseudomonadota bacterium]